MLAALAAGWLLAGAPAHAACDDGAAGGCTYSAAPSESKADGDKKADKASAKRESRRRGGRVSRRYSRHRSAYRSGRRLARSSRHSRRYMATMRGSIRPAHDQQERAAPAVREEEAVERTVNADDQTVGVLPQAMETGTTLSPVPDTPLASALRLPFGLASAQAQPVVAEAGPSDTMPVRMADASGQRAPAPDMQQASATVGQAMRSPPEQSDTMLLRAMFLTLAGALVLATAVRLIVG
ncbi:MAG: hypothetical protein IT538_06195 [Variibacter sp.]|nr:hypothetical protein [Variibacter sp.]